MIKTKPKPEEKQKTPAKQRIREIIKKPKDKFLTKSQKDYWSILGENQITLCFGPSGTGKSHISIKKALDLLWDEDNKYEKIIILRPIVLVGKDLGSIPGDLISKLDPYVYPTYYLINKIIGQGAREALIEDGFLETMAISYCRGINFENSIVCLEESQNASMEEMKLILTRIGYNSKLFLSGDIEQSDKFKDGKKSGFYDAKDRLTNMKDVGIFEFGINDIVRNPIIGEILKRYAD